MFDVNVLLDIFRSCLKMLSECNRVSWKLPLDAVGIPSIISCNASPSSQPPTRLC